MRNLVVNPFGDTEYYGQNNLERIAQPNTEFDVDHIGNMYPLRNNHWLICTRMGRLKRSCTPRSRATTLS